MNLRDRRRCAYLACSVLAGLFMWGRRIQRFTLSMPAPARRLWSYTTGGFVESSPAVANDAVYIGSDDDNVYALNAGPVREGTSTLLALVNRLPNQAFH